MQPSPRTCSSLPVLPGSMYVYVGQLAAVCWVGPWPDISATSLASGEDATAS